jgi:EAL domain-containing protein (putative c-di-GMP-specific phosphodiesterase class I)
MRAGRPPGASSWRRALQRDFSFDSGGGGRGNLADDDFATKVADLLLQNDLPASLLEIEVTESAVMLDPDKATRFLNQLHGLGVRIALDDFGAGYTSLAQFKTLPISELKIDKSFILTMDSNRDGALIVRSMVDLGHSLNMKVVAEGVETANVANMLTDYQCDMAQGYHLCRPALAEALMRWYNERPVNPDLPRDLAPTKKSGPSGLTRPKTPEDASPSPLLPRGR